MRDYLPKERGFKPAPVLDESASLFVFHKQAAFLRGFTACFL
jgi:hypothetical protein